MRFGLFERFTPRLEQWLEQERDQLVLWLPIGFGCGIAAWFLIPLKIGWAAFILGGLGLAALALAFGGPGRAGRALVLFMIFVSLGCGRVWWRAEKVAAIPLDRVRIVLFEARIERVEQLVARDMVRLTLASIDGQGLPARVRVNVVTAYAVDGLAPGRRIKLRARLLPPPDAAVPGGYDFSRIAWFKGIGATGRALDRVRLLPGDETASFATLLAGWRARLTAHVHRQLPGSQGGIAAALVTGDQGGIDEADAEAMRISGLAHLLSISGMHVGVVIGGAMLLVMRLLALSPRLALRWPLPAIAAGIAALVGICYTLLAGAEVPTIRSCIAALLVLAALMIGREALTLRLVGAAALILLAIWPEALVGASFQLSFAAVVTIVALNSHPAVHALLARREEGAGARILRVGLGLLLTGIAIELALTPIALFHFHRAGLYGALANLVAIPLTSFVIMPAEALALLCDTFGLGAPFWWVAGQTIGWLLDLAHHVAALPGASTRLPAMPVAAFALMAGGGIWVALWQKRPRWLGLAPLGLGAAWAVAIPRPDLLVTSDGRHVAIRSGDGAALLRPRAGDYVRGLLAETGGLDGLVDLDRLPSARCSADICLAMIEGRQILATRSAYRVNWAELVAGCERADIAISDRRLPRACNPRWLRLDPTTLQRTGGVAIRFSPFVVETVRRPRDDHPWLRMQVRSRERR